ncbi:hypothetical protein ACFL2V_01410 [Pseudomonadota bacterium]
MHAEFSMNFVPQTATGEITTVNWNSDDGIHNGQDSGQTPYLYDTTLLERPEIIVDPDNGNSYYHMIVGSFADGFIQESFIQMGFGGYGNPLEPTNSASASGGTAEGAGDYDSDITFGNGYDPLDMDANETAKLMGSGNGTGNPNRVILRQIINDGEIMMEFRKSSYLKKPRITQMIMAPDITALFDMDMSAIDYNTDDGTPIVMNTMELWGDDVLYDASAFDMSQRQEDDPLVTGVDDSYISGGDYLYTDGTDFGGSDGTYSYATGSFDHKAISWKDIFDPFEHNPWNFEDGKLP